MLPNTADNKPFVFAKDQLEKLGNTLIFLLQHDPQMNWTKILHSLFLLEEAAWKNYIQPFFDVPFQLWKTGPVAKDVYLGLIEENPALLAGYIKNAAGDTDLFLPVTKFSDEPFSENEMEMLKAVTNFVTYKTGDELTHHNTGVNSLWYQNAVRLGILQLFEKGTLYSTGITTDFSLLFSDDASLKRYYSVKQTLALIRQHKR
jgi:hypothetical protein